MTRTAAREIAVRICFGLIEIPKAPDILLGEMFDETYYKTFAAEDDLYSEYPDDAQMQYVSRLIRGIIAHGAELDGYIEKYAVGWKFGRISRTAVAVLKTAMFEVLYMPDVPNSAAINEAVELAKRYDVPETVKFVNGVLGSFARNEVTNA